MSELLMIPAHAGLSHSSSQSFLRLAESAHYTRVLPATSPTNFFYFVSFSLILSSSDPINRFDPSPIPLPNFVTFFRNSESNKKKKTEDHKRDKAKRREKKKKEKKKVRSTSQPRSSRALGWTKSAATAAAGSNTFWLERLAKRESARLCDRGLISLPGWNG